MDILPALIESLSSCSFLTDHLALPHTHAEDEGEAGVEAEGAGDKGRRREGGDPRDWKLHGRRGEKKLKGRHPVQTDHVESNTDPDPGPISSGRYTVLAASSACPTLCPISS